MTLEEKVLYHQIHPAKLLADVGGGFIALYPLWQHDLLAALLTALLPAIIASVVIIRYVDLEKYKQSAFGKYVRRYMTRLVEAIRLAGFLIMAVGAWHQMVWVIVVGLAIVVLAWLRGIILPGGPRKEG